MGTLSTRPDDRSFLSVQAEDPGTFRLLVRAATHVSGLRLHIDCQPDDRDRIGCLTDLGYTPALATEVFSVRFVDVEKLVRRAWTPAGVALAEADQVDSTRLVRSMSRR